MTSIVINNLSYSIPNTPVYFDKLNLAFDKARYGIVGDNGIGKSTLIKLIAGELTPHAGDIIRPENIIYLPQNMINKKRNISEVLGVDKILMALENIHNGSCDEQNFEIINNHWDINEKIKQAFDYFNLTKIDLNTAYSKLSGGQQTKILLSQILIFNPEFILLDEPSNNLDYISKNILSNFIENYINGLILISHDRKLLNQMDNVIELTQKKINHYGGNYDFYKTQKDIQTAAFEQELLDTKKENLKIKRSIQTSREKHDKLASRGRKAFRDGSVDKLTANSKKGRSEKSKSRMVTQEEKMLNETNTKLDNLKDKINLAQKINPKLDGDIGKQHKQILEIKNLSFYYSNPNESIITGVDFRLMGSERVAIIGPNGSGKSTIIKLIQKKLTPGEGQIHLYSDPIAYLDQQLDFLDPNLNLIENYLLLNPNQNEFAAHSVLANYGFRNQAALKKISQLSGGERMRAGLAIILASKPTPELIILDEPTNHLDLNSILAIETMLTTYHGALLVVSHDKNFLTNIGIQRVLHLG